MLCFDKNILRSRVFRLNVMSLGNTACSKRCKVWHSERREHRFPRACFDRMLYFWDKSTCMYVYIYVYMYGGWMDGWTDMCVYTYVCTGEYFLQFHFNLKQITVFNRILNLINLHISVVTI